MQTKNEIYQSLCQQVEAITSGETDLIANMANLSAILFNGLPDINWAGFYLYKEEQLVLGPFQGKPACIRIPLGKGVCGEAALSRNALVVDNVHEFKGHIACDTKSNSEIVLPIVITTEGQDTLIGVLDIDSPSFARFDEQDQYHLQKLVDILCSRIIAATTTRPNT